MSKVVLCWPSGYCLFCHIDINYNNFPDGKMASKIQDIKSLPEKKSMYTKYSQILFLYGQPIHLPHIYHLLRNIKQGTWLTIELSLKLQHSEKNSNKPDFSDVYSDSVILVY